MNKISWQSPSEHLFEKDESVSTHNKHLQKHATEIYKVSEGLLPPFMTELIKPRNDYPYHLRHVSPFNTASLNTVYHGTESISFLGPNISNLCQMT